MTCIGHVCVHVCMCECAYITCYDIGGVCYAHKAVCPGSGS